MEERPDGYYWVRPPGEAWVPAELLNGEWIVLGWHNDISWTDDDVGEVGGRLEGQRDAESSQP